MRPRRKSVPTYETATFAATVRQIDGKNTIELSAAPYYRTWLAKHTKPGDIVSMSLTLKKPKRTQRQNNYYWVYISEIASETGNDPEELHELFKARFLGLGVKVVLGEEITRNRSTTELSRLEFGEYIDKVADFTGIQPPPPENYRI